MDIVLTLLLFCHFQDFQIHFNDNTHIGEGNGNPLQYSCLENPVHKEVLRYSPWGCKRVRHTVHIFLQSP